MQASLGLRERAPPKRTLVSAIKYGIFADRGIFGEAAVKRGRICILIDENPIATRMMKNLLVHYNPIQEKEKTSRRYRKSNG